MIESPFFYYAALKDASGSILLDEDTRRHVVTVLRMQVGAHIMLMDGQGHSADVVIDLADKKTLKVSIIEKNRQKLYLQTQSESLLLCSLRTLNMQF
jgi:16S rRNA U1498 N3-methylase RsmE